MTNIKCKKCEHDIEIPSVDRNCNHCGEAVIKSVNLAAKEIKLESKAINNNRKIGAKAIKSLQKTTEKEILNNGKVVNGIMKDIRDKAAAQIKAMPDDTTREVMLEITNKANKDQADIFEAGTKDAEAIMNKHTDEVAKIAKAMGVEPPDYSLSVKKIGKNDVLINKQVTSKKFREFIQYGTFFLITPLGMLTIESYFPIGLLLVLAGFLALPPLSKKITSTYSWLSEATLMLMTHVIIVTALYKLTTLLAS